MIQVLWGNCFSVVCGKRVRGLDILYVGERMINVRQLTLARIGKEEIINRREEKRKKAKMVFLLGQ